MIIRVVKMTFEAEKVENFLSVFNASKDRIRKFEGCSHLELWNDVNNPTVFFTYSHWQSEEHLHQYRHSDLFIGVWSKTKILFSARPEAWSVVQQTV